MTYTCRDYREEMRLLALRRQLTRKGLSDDKKNDILRHISKLEKEMDME